MRSPGTRQPHAVSHCPVCRLCSMAHVRGDVVGAARSEPCLGRGAAERLWGEVVIHVGEEIF